MNNIEQLNNETIELTKQAFAQTNAGLQKAITTGTGLQGYSLEAPSKKVYPVLSPLRNRIARVTATVGSLAAHWKAITGINTQNVKAAVAFGTRNASTLTYSEKDLSATYKTFGLDDAVQDESVWLGRGFEDVRALSALATLQATMIEEEKLILGGVTNTSTFGVPTTPTTGAGGSGSAWGAVNAYVKVVALPLYGYLNSDLNALASLGDHSSLSAATAAQALTSGQNLYVSTAPLPGAFAYAWFVSSAAGADPGDASRKIAAITTVPSATITGPAAGGALAASTIVADTSGDANAFDGLYTQILNPGVTLTSIGASIASGQLKQVTGPVGAITGAIVFDMLNSAASATAGGTVLTGDGAGGVIEFDAVLKALWDYSRIGPSLIVLNSQEALNVTKKVAANNTGAQFRIGVNDGTKDITGGLFVSGYLNKFTSSMTPGNPDVIPFLVHPYLPPSTVLFISERLPYPNNMIPNVLEMELQQEYADFEWARTQRQYEHGVYAMGVLKNYFPAGCAVIRGIANG